MMHLSASLVGKAEFLGVCFTVQLTLQASACFPSRTETAMWLSFDFLLLYKQRADEEQGKAEIGQVLCPMHNDDNLRVSQKILLQSIY